VAQHPTLGPGTLEQRHPLRHDRCPRVPNGLADRLAPAPQRLLVHGPPLHGLDSAPPVEGVANHGGVGLPLGRRRRRAADMDAPHQRPPPPPDGPATTDAGASFNARASLWGGTPTPTAARCGVPGRWCSASIGSTRPTIEAVPLALRTRHTVEYAKVTVRPQR